VLSAAPAFAQAEAEWTAQTQREAAPQRREDAFEPRRDDRDGVHFRMLRSYYLAADATASEPIVVVGGDAIIDGKTDDDVVVIGGTLRLGPRAIVGGDVVTVGGDAAIDPAATVRGKIDTASVVFPNVDWQVGGPIWRETRLHWSEWWPLAALSATVLRLTLVLVISMLLTVIAPGWVRSMGMRASSAVSAGLVGAIAEILFIPVLIAVVIGLVISIVGIPLLGAIPFALALGGLAWTGGFAAVAASLGARLRGSSIDRSSSLVSDVMTGFIAISGLTMVAHVIWVGPGWMTPLGWMTSAAGVIVEYLAWTIGLGAALSGRFVRSQAPPPMPAPSASF
jgi:hypothetical protein